MKRLLTVLAALPVAVVAPALPAKGGIGSGTVAPGTATISDGKAPTSRTWMNAACTYAGTTLELHANAGSNPANAAQYIGQTVAARCTLYLKDGTGYATSAYANGSGWDTAIGSGSATVPAGAAVRKICLSAEAQWWGSATASASFDFCQYPGVTAWVEDNTFVVPLEQS